jgi:polyhydroxyalkanoate synthesis regulator phasin
MCIPQQYAALRNATCQLGCEKGLRLDIDISETGNFVRHNNLFWRALAFQRSMLSQCTRLITYQTTSRAFILNDPVLLTVSKMAATGEFTVEDALNMLANVADNSGKVRNDVKDDIRAAVSCIRKEITSLKSEVESTNKRITDLETIAGETHSLLNALMDGVGGNGRKEQEATSSGLSANFKNDDGRADEPAGGKRRRYADVVVNRRPGEGGTKTLTAQTEQSKEREDEEKKIYTEARQGEYPINPNLEEEEEEDLEELAGFEAVMYRRNRRRQRQQVIIGTSSDSEIKAEKIKAWVYLGKMSQETTIDGVGNFLNRKGIKEETVIEELRTMGPYKTFKLGFPYEHLHGTENKEFCSQGAIIRQFRIRYRARRQYRGTTIDTGV